MLKENGYQESVISKVINRITITAFLIQNEYKIIPHEVITYTQYSQDKIFFLRWKYFT